MREVTGDDIVRLTDAILKLERTMLDLVGTIKRSKALS